MGLKKLAIALLLVLAGAWPPLAAGQFIGYNAAQSTIQNIFVNHTGNGISPTITNLGQSSHFLTICNNQFQGTVIFEASRDGTFTPPTTIAAANYGDVPGAGARQAPDSNCHLLQAGGYYPTLRVRITNALPTTGTTTIFYSGIGGPVAPNPAALATKGPSSPIACEDHFSAPGLAPSLAAPVNVKFAVPGATVIVCEITISFDAATTAGLLIFGEDTTGSLGVTCPTTITNLFVIAVTPTTTNPIHITGNPGGMFRLDPSTSLCFTTGTVGANTYLETSFAQITF